jgi:nitroimidazol reductase NimA-like FMN-containing flavoprotein (pyridoxamine 5'-phosphate oxidase superfamily)
MSKNINSKPITKMRRDDRTADDIWIKEFLRIAPHGVLATTNEGQPFANMNTFYYDKETNSIFMHTAKRGRTRDNIDNEEKVSFAVSEMGRFLPADVARELSVEYKSVIVFGVGKVIEDKIFARDKMKLYVEKYFHHLVYGEDIRTITPKEIEEISTYQIEISSWSGKVKKEADDFPGAFLYTPPSL